MTPHPGAHFRREVPQEATKNKRDRAEREQNETLIMDTAPLAYPKGASVLIKGLSSRGDLNGKTGFLASGKVNTQTGRVVVVVHASGPTKERVKMKPANFDLRLPPAVASVLALPPLLAAIFAFLPRWERWGRLTGAARAWRQTARGGVDKDLWRYVVVVPEAEALPGVAAMAGRLQRLPNNDAYTVTRHVHQGALPLRAAELSLMVPDLSLVETLAVPGTVGRYAEGDAFPDLIPKGTPVPDDIAWLRTGYDHVDKRYFHLKEMRMVCSRIFPALKSLVVNFIGMSFHFPGMSSGDFELLKGWLGALPPTLEVLHLDIARDCVDDERARMLWGSMPFDRMPNLRACSDLPPLAVLKGDQGGLPARANLEVAPWAGSDICTKSFVASGVRGVIEGLGGSPIADGGDRSSRFDCLAAYLKALPSLRALHWQGNFDGHEDFHNFLGALALSGPHIERLFLSLDTTVFISMDSDADERQDDPSQWESIFTQFSAFAKNPPYLREVVIDCDDCYERTHVRMGEKEYKEQIAVIRKALPNAAVCVCDCSDPAVAPGPCEKSLDMEHYVLPSLLEAWQIHPLVFEQELPTRGRSKLVMGELATDQNVGMLVASMANER